jgi:predicted TIM-barrel fold metal-dependent hydrolase
LQYFHRRPESAADELERAVTKLGSRRDAHGPQYGAGATFLDDKRLPIYERAQAGVPIYLIRRRRIRRWWRPTTSDSKEFPA